MTSVISRKIRWQIFAILLLPWTVQVSLAQEKTIETEVTDTAGETIYLPLGSSDGIQAGDTLHVFLEAEMMGSLRVIRVTRSRLLATRLSDRFELTRGQRITVRFFASPVLEPTPPEVTDPVDIPVRPSLLDSSLSTRRPLKRRSLRFNGRLSAGSSFVFSGAGGGGSRTYSIPYLALRGDIQPASNSSTRFRFDTRATYLQQSSFSVQDPVSVRLYRIQLEHDVARLPLSVTGGRFYPGSDAYSGYWDGGSVQFGSDENKIGFLAGFQPVRGNEAFTSTLPKLALFGKMETGSGNVSYRAEASVTHLRPTEQEITHSYAGLSQYLMVGRLRISQRLRVDQNVQESGLTVSQAMIQAAFSVSRSIRLTSSYFIREPFFISEKTSRFGLKRTDVRAGISWRSAMSGIQLNYAQQHSIGRSESRGITLSANTSNLPIQGAMVSTTATYWRLEDDQTTSLLAAFDVPYSSFSIRTGLGYYQYTYIGITRQTFSPEFQVRWQTNRDISMFARWQGRFDDVYAVHRLNTGIWIRF